MISVHIDQKQRKLPIASASVEAAALFLLRAKRAACEEIAFHFVSKKKIAALHKKYFNDPAPTDCISFPIDAKFCLGEIFICPETALEYAEDHRLDPYEEATRYLIHGILHLLGYDDLEELGRRRMKREENRCLKLLKAKKLLLKKKKLAPID